MNLLDWITPNRIKQRFADYVYQYWISSGTVNTMENDTGVFLNEAYKGNISVYSIIDRIDKMRQQAPLRLYKKTHQVNSKKLPITNYISSRKK